MPAASLLKHDYTIETGYRSVRLLDRCSDGTYWAIYSAGASGQLRYSKDLGATWNDAVLGATFTTSGAVSGFIDEDDYFHLVHGFTDGTTWYLYYSRGTPNAGRTGWTWSAPLTITANAGLNAWHPDVVAARDGAGGWRAYLLWSDGVANLTKVTIVTVSSAGVIAFLSDNALPTPGPHVDGSLEMEHTGNGKTPSVTGNPALWVCSSGKAIRGTLSGSTITWSAEANSGSIAANVAIQWDGTRATWLAYSTGGITQFYVHQVVTPGVLTSLTPPVTPVAIYSGAHWANTNGDVYIVMVGSAATALAYWIKYTRATATWGAWTSFALPYSAAWDFILPRRGPAYGSRLNGTMVDKAAPYDVFYLETLSLNVAPSYPTLGAPSDSSTVDLAAGYTFNWTFNDLDVGDTQLSWTFRRKIGAGSYEYWNNTTLLWQGTEVWNTGSASSVTFGASKWTNGNTYNWSVNTRDAAGYTGTYAPDHTVIAGGGPAVEVTGPIGNITDTTTPTVSWSMTDPDGDPQQTWRVKIFTAEQYVLVGFDPDVDVPVWDSGETSEALTRSRTVGTPLSNTLTYRAYVQISANGQYSVWDYTTFSILLDPPAVPSLAVVTDPTHARNVITVSGHDNLLSANASSMETDISGWVADLNVAATYPQRSILQAVSGVASLLLRSTAVGDIQVRSAVRYPVVAGVTYTARASFRPSAAPTRNTRVIIRWFNVATGGVELSATSGALLSEALGAWVSPFATAAAPVGATFAEVVLVVRTAAAAENHYADTVSLIPGTSTAWTRGGLTGLARAVVEYYDGSAWRRIRSYSVAYDAAATQQAVLYDYEAPFYQPRQYRAYSVGDV